MGTGWRTGTIVPARVHYGVLHALALAGFLAIQAAPSAPAAPTPATSSAPARTQQLPDRLADTTFWRMISEFSEAGGSFQSDNFVSNEWELQYEIPAVRTRVGDRLKTVGAYVGVGPEQNLTYVTAFQPRIAFIVDIRRQNMIQHLLFKALIEISADRAEFLSRLWSRPRPAGLDSLSSPRALVASFDVAVKDSARYRDNLAAVFAQLVDRHRFALSAEDSVSVRYVYDAFFTYGPSISYSPGRMGSPMVTIRGSTAVGSDGSTRITWSTPTTTTGALAPPYSASQMPSFADLMVEEDGQGTNQGWLASESNYRVLQDYQKRNLIVPLVGNFAGPKTLRAVGAYLRERSMSLSVFYLSNVEQYLFQQGDEWSRFYSNVATMPYDSTSSLIRSVSNPRFVQPRHQRSRMAQLSSSVSALIRAFQDGRIASYYDAVMLLQ